MMQELCPQSTPGGLLDIQNENIAVSQSSSMGIAQALPVASISYGFVSCDFTQNITPRTYTLIKVCAHKVAIHHHRTYVMDYSYIIHLPTKTL